MNINIFHWTSDSDIFNCESDFIEDKKFITPPCDDLNHNHHMMLGYLSDSRWYDGKLNAKIIEETNGLIPDCHFGEYGHKKQADYFYNHIINNLL